MAVTPRNKPHIRIRSTPAFNGMGIKYWEVRFPNGYKLLVYDEKQLALCCDKYKNASREDMAEDE